jgi:hypothetical protein
MRETRMCLAERRRRGLETTAWSVAAGAVVLIAVAVEEWFASAALNAAGNRDYTLVVIPKAIHAISR